MFDGRTLFGIQGRVGVAEGGIGNAGVGGIGHDAAGREMPELYIYPVELRKRDL
jgi:hypothetical protein